MHQLVHDPITGRFQRRYSCSFCRMIRINGQPCHEHRHRDIPFRSNCDEHISLSEGTLKAKFSPLLLSPMCR